MKYLLPACLILLGGCASENSRAYRDQQHYKQDYGVIADALRYAAPAGKKVLRTTHQMFLNGKIIRGGCWDYLNAAFDKAGYPYAKRQRIYFGSKKGPYAPSHLLWPGDWVYHINHSYNGVEHSGMFVGWIDRRRKLALMFSYAGERRSEPARYKRYDLSSVYSIQRAVN